MVDWVLNCLCFSRFTLGGFGHWTKNEVFHSRNCGICHIYWRNPWRKTSFFVQSELNSKKAFGIVFRILSNIYYGDFLLKVVDYFRKKAITKKRILKPWTTETIFPFVLIFLNFFNGVLISSLHQQLRKIETKFHLWYSYSVIF